MCTKKISREQREFRAYRNVASVGCGISCAHSEKDVRKEVYGKAITCEEEDRRCWISVNGADQESGKDLSRVEIQTCKEANIID